MTTLSQFDRYAEAIASLPTAFATQMPLPNALRMTGDHRHEIYYAPFDHVTLTARVVIVGITPGRVQAVAALEAARQALRRGLPHTEAAEIAKATASFAGPMRRNLVDLLDHVGVANRLGICSTAEFWGAEQHLAHFTSALRYPVFEGGKNYSGGKLDASTLLMGELDRWFSTECRDLPAALYVPLGPTALKACERQVATGILQRDQILAGLPHPSGANAERIAYFLGRKPRHLLSAKTRPETLEAGRDRALRTVAGWA
ncbi:hypothetical protein CNR27_00840 [Luteimonas chenhongjianii]|uniref:Uracil-DNA glycosylase-like domain-containing protein n=1 Tax=Luteimonas chenhongjianii TaxID=2006110 RepID=A0A290XB17_9GAMM|nr:hypothetical protein [Luteimonas chenhongjianii]ATD66178.1 hypothetical protein CNR27_00840 [Luteimonas chenhongjianii]